MRVEITIYGSLDGKSVLNKIIKILDKMGFMPALNPDGSDAVYYGERLQQAVYYLPDDLHSSVTSTKEVDE